MTPNNILKASPSASGQWKPSLAPFEHRSHNPTTSRVSKFSVSTGQNNHNSYGHSMYDIDLKGLTGVSKDPVAARDFSSSSVPAVAVAGYDHVVSSSPSAHVTDPNSRRSGGYEGNGG